MTDHEHRWTTGSTHPASEGVVTYQRCTCGEHRVTLSPPVTLAHSTGRTRRGR